MNFKDKNGLRNREKTGINDQKLWETGINGFRNFEEKKQLQEFSGEA